MPNLTERVKGVDITIVLSIPLVLVGIQFLPDALRGALILNYGSPSVFQSYTTHFVHADWEHLAGNVAVYLVAVALVYALCLYADARRKFYVGFAVVLFVVPFPVSALDLWLVGPKVGDLPTRGFSGLASAFVGFLPVAVFVFLRENLSDGLRVYESLGLFLVGLGVVLLIYTSPTEPAVWLALGAGVLYYVHPFRKLGPEERARVREWGLARRSVVTYAVLFFVVSPVLLFPANPASGGSLVNVVTHFGGFFVGYVAVGVGVYISSLYEPMIPKDER